MAELETTYSGEKRDYGFRSQLLMPVVEGNTLESDDVSGFLGGRLTIAGDEPERKTPIRLS